MDECTDIDIDMTFFNISKSLNTSFVQESTIEDLDKQLSEEFDSVIKNKDLRNDTNDLMANIKEEVNSIEIRKDFIEDALVSAKISDASFLEREIKSLIVSSKKVLETLEKDIKVGASPRMYEVYATLLGAITSQYKELRNLNESVAKFYLENKKYTLEETKEERKMMLTSDDMLSMYIQAKQSSNMDAIDADFDIEDKF